MRVLVVEDETDIADAVQRFLQGQGHAIDLVANLAEAAAFLGVAEFDAILLDLALPDGVKIFCARNGAGGTAYLSLLRQRVTRLPIELPGLTRARMTMWSSPTIWARSRRGCAPPMADALAETLHPRRHWAICGLTGPARGYSVGAPEIRLTSRED